MKVEENKKVLVLTDIDSGTESLVVQETGIQPENMLTVHSYGSVISQPFGEIMRSIIIAIYQEKIEEIFVVGIEGKTTSVNIQNNFKSIENKVLTLDYLFEYCKPELKGNTFEDWLNGKENVSENVENSIDMIRRHPLVPSYVHVRGLLVNKDERYKMMEV